MGLKDYPHLPLWKCFTQVSYKIGNCLWHLHNIAAWKDNWGYIPMFTIMSSSDFHMCLCFMQRTEDSSSSKQHVNGLPSLGRGKTAHSACPVQRPKFSSRTLPGNHPQRKRDQRNKLLRVHFLRSAPGSLIVKAEPKQKTVVCHLAMKTKVGLCHFCILMIPLWTICSQLPE